MSVLERFYILRTDQNNSLRKLPLIEANFIYVLPIDHTHVKISIATFE
jgi:hypothetical protein